MQRVTRHYLPDVLPEYPAALTVASGGPAGNVQSSRMGVYLKNDSQQYNNRPVYELDRGGKFIYFEDNGHWDIGSRVGGGAGISTLKSGLLTPPVTGWRYYDHDEQWKDDDPQLTVTGETITMFCQCH